MAAGGEGADVGPGLAGGADAGVQERLGSSFGRDLDNSVYIPVTAFNRMYGPGNGFALFGRPRPGSGLNLEGALDETRVLLRTRFHARPGQPDNFDTLTPDAIRGFIDQVLGIGVHRHGGINLRLIG